MKDKPKMKPQASVRGKSIYGWLKMLLAVILAAQVSSGPVLAVTTDEALVSIEPAPHPTLEIEGEEQETAQTEECVPPEELDAHIQRLARRGKLIQAFETCATPRNSCLTEEKRRELVARYRDKKELDEAIRKAEAACSMEIAGAPGFSGIGLGLLAAPLLGLLSGGGGAGTAVAFLGGGGAGFTDIPVTDPTTVIETPTNGNGGSGSGGGGTTETPPTDTPPTDEFQEIVAPAPVPVPASGLMILGAIAALRLLRRR